MHVEIQNDVVLFFSFFFNFFFWDQQYSKIENAFKKEDNGDF